MEGTARARERRRIGPWRLLDIVTATMPLRGGTFMAVAIVPEYGPPDAPDPTPEPAELPDLLVLEFHGVSQAVEALKRIESDPLVGEVRSLGLIGAIEIVSRKGTNHEAGTHLDPCVRHSSHGVGGERVGELHAVGAVRDRVEGNRRASAGG